MSQSILQSGASLKLHRSRIHACCSIFLATVFLLLFSQGAASADSTRSKLTISYYYNNPCASCHEDKDFKDLFLGLVGESAQDVTLDFSFYNVFRAEDQKKYSEACQQYGILPEEQTTPLLVIGDTPLNGKEEINQKLISVFQEEKGKKLRQAAITSGTASRIVYFYVSPCEECAETEQYLSGLAPTYLVSYNGKELDSMLIIESHNVAEKQNLELVNRYFRDHQVPQARQSVPVVFLRDGYLSGKEEIINGLQAAIEGGRCIGIASPGDQVELKIYDWPTVFLMGLINGFNPCSISMLLFLIALLLARKANVLKLGMLFIIGKFLAYLALGTILFSLLSTINNSVFALFSDIGKYILLALMIVVVALNLNDFFASKYEKYNKIRLQLPQGLRRLNHKWLSSISSMNGAGLLFAAFILGIAISIGEFLCTGQIYLATIIYLLKRSNVFDLQIVVSFLLYIIGMLLPLLIITITVHKGKEIFRVSEFARSRMPLIKLINACVFLVLAVILFIFF